MLLLAADTSSRDGCVGLVRGEADGTCELLESTRLDGGAFSAQLIPQIAALLSNRGFSKKDIGGFVVVSGPGSFTGLRVGLAAIKALAEVLAKPIAAVSLLEAIAMAGGLKGKITAALDAGRQQVYVGEYEISFGPARRINENLVTREEFWHLLPEGANVVTPSSELADSTKGAGIHLQVIAAPDLRSIAGLGWRKMLSGESLLPEDLEANYISRLHAEVPSTGAARHLRGSE